MADEMTDPTNNASNKLLVRRHVLTSIQALSAINKPSKESKLTQLERLKTLNTPQAVCDVLVKELERTPDDNQRQIISEFLMELADIEWVRDGLWRIIQSPHTPDGTKDNANLILRNLGDETDPDVYLDYLKDPEALITEETERMLQIATKNPESLIDFIDFIVSLPVGEQLRLLRSLQSDYPPDYLIHLFIPLYWANTPPELKDHVIEQVLKSHLPLAKSLLQDVSQYDHDPKRKTLAKKEVNKPQLTTVQNNANPLAVSTEDNAFSEPAICYATLPDGIGNQGILYSRKKQNGDTTLIGFALNDTYGLMDCFGFYQLSPNEVTQLVEKFHEESLKIPVPESYCQEKLQDAEAFNKTEGTPIPYEYMCWKSIFETSHQGTTKEAFEDASLARCRQLADTKWSLSTQNLYLHPDFETWFIEIGDIPPITKVLKQAQEDILHGLQNQTETTALIARVDQAAQEIVKAVLHDSDHKQRFLNRLIDATYLLSQSDTQSFAPLAATEVMKLIDYPKDKEETIAQCGFICAFGRRCLTEHLLRMQQHPKQYDVIAPRQLDALVSAILVQWEDEFSLDPEATGNQTEDNS